MNSKYFIYALILLTGHSAVVQNIEQDYVTPSQVVLREAGDSLQVSLKLTSGKRTIEKMDKIIVTPMLVGSPAASQPLPSFVFYGKSRWKLETRKAKLDRQPAPKEMKEYSYDVEFPFQPWMEEARLVLDVRRTSCADCPTGDTRILLADTVALFPKVPYVMRPLANFVTPKAEPIKNRVETGSTRIEFLSGRSVIMPHYKGNAGELTKINTAIRQVLADTLAQIHSIVLTACSSPEGTYASNEKLSKARAQALKMYLQTNSGLKGVPIETQAIAEDWETLRGMIAGSDYVWKDAALKIIDETGIFDGREKKLMMLNGGKPYGVMLREWFPLLRKTDYQLNYSVKDFTVEQGRKVIKIRPGQMSLNEMLHVAHSYEKGSPEFNEVFDIAVRLFPTDPVANINAAAAALNRADTLSAKKYLNRVENIPQAENNRAVYYMLTRELDRATECLQKADGALPEVEHNVKEVALKRSNNMLFDKYKRRQ